MMLFPIILVLTCWASVSHARGSIWTYTVNAENQGTYTTFPNYLYKGSYIAVSVLCESKSPDSKVHVNWILQKMTCMEDMLNLQTKSQLTILEYVMSSLNPNPSHSQAAAPPPEMMHLQDPALYEPIQFQSSSVQAFSCGGKRIIELKDESWDDYKIAYVPKNKTEKESLGTSVVKSVSRNNVKNTTTTTRVTELWEAGMYHFLLTVSSTNKSEIKATVRVEMGGDYGFMPANQWPLLPYSAVMSLLYLVQGTVWIVLWARAHTHTLKIHLVIGAITVAGAMCNTLLFVNMASLNSKGQIVEAVLWIVELLAALQDSLMHLLFMVVSTGYGITRPTLSRDLLSIMMTLTAFSFLASVGLIVVIDEQLQLKYLYPIFSLIVLILYGVILLCIGAFIMGMSVSTLVHLWKRKHASNKLYVFAVYMVTSCVAFVVSLAMIGFSNGFYTSCRTDWQHEWLYANFGHMEGALLLMVLMWLWRPVDTWQSYAFSPLGGEEDARGENMDDSDDEGSKEKIALKMEPI